MVIASIIIGVIFIIGGIFCMTAPVETFLSIMSLFAAVLFVYGIFGVIRFFQKKARVPEFIVSILAAIIGFVYLFRPGNTPAPGTMMGLDRTVLFLVAAWFLIKGCLSIYYSVRTRFVNSRWIFGFLTGLMSVILGIFSFVYPSIAASSVGILVGLWFIEAGIDFIAFGMTVGYVENAVRETEKEIDSAMKKLRSAAGKYSEEIHSRTTETAGSDTEDVTPQDPGKTE